MPENSITLLHEYQ